MSEITPLKIEIIKFKKEIHISVISLPEDRALLTHIFGEKTWNTDEQFAVTGATIVVDAFCEAYKDKLDSFNTNQLQHSLVEGLSFFLNEEKEKNNAKSD